MPALHPPGGDGAVGRTTTASLVAVLGLLVLGLLVVLNPVPYVAVAPGPTVDVLGRTGTDRPVIRVQGSRTYPTDGQIRLVTVTVDGPQAEVLLPDALRTWLAPDDALIPRAVYYPEPSTREEQRAESAAQMVGSQDSAVAAALRRLGFDLAEYPEVLGVSPGGPSQGKLEPRDRVLAVAGRRTPDVPAVFEALGAQEPGDPVTVRVRRDGEVVPVEVTTRAAADDPQRAQLGVLIGTGYRFPFEVSVAPDDDIGGPSAGLMFALSVYDVLTPGSLTGGAVVSGTGTIDADGRVGEIGGVAQKVVAAADAGAELFFVPPGNCDGALESPAADRLELVRAGTLADALAALEAWAADPGAELPRCPA